MSDQYQIENTARFFSNRLKALRGSLSQAEFCRKIGVESQATYSRYEKGRIPDGGVLLTIATHLGITVDSLLHPPSEPFPSESPRIMEEPTHTEINSPLGAERIRLATKLYTDARDLRIIADRLEQQAHDLENRRD